MIKIAIYGKGGIGKSTTVSNLSAVFAQMGKTVLQIGCDPKADSTVSLHDGKPITPVLDLIRARGDDFALSEMVTRGAFGVLCVEAGGPAPGTGCAGRGIIAALEKLREKGAYETYRPDVVFYDVLGDVVCGGFSMPMRAGYADKVYVVTSGENMAIHAAANIAEAVRNFAGRGYAKLGGLILNKRNVPHEEEKVAELADDVQTVVTGHIGLSTDVQSASDRYKTVLATAPQSKSAAQYRALAARILSDFEGDVSA